MKSHVSRRRRGLMGEMNDVYCLRRPSLASRVLSTFPASGSEFRQRQRR
ncbi:hypothetical protein [Escherichia coli]|nr:hypothetical protein [Escherichia coli]EEQ3603878.1 hypothetical protein [Escherichia coli]EES3021857.1 hypothetical protein [Escherichia coli]MCW7337613.1 hypothetical protein [Escherichia coli]MCW7378763.1 hypothetical protein [Escherichia coli]